MIYIEHVYCIVYSSALLYVICMCVFSLLLFLSLLFSLYRSLYIAHIALYLSLCLQLSSSKVSRRDYDGLNRRVNNIEDTMMQEKANGLSMPEIADRLEVLEKTAADLRVRTVLEEQVTPTHLAWHILSSSCMYSYDILLPLRSISLFKLYSCIYQLTTLSLSDVTSLYDRCKDWPRPRETQWCSRLS